MPEGRGFRHKVKTIGLSFDDLRHVGGLQRIVAVCQPSPRVFPIPVPYTLARFLTSDIPSILDEMSTCVDISQKPAWPSQAHRRPVRYGNGTRRTIHIVPSMSFRPYCSTRSVFNGHTLLNHQSGHPAGKTASHCSQTYPETDTV